MTPRTNTARLDGKTLVISQENPHENEGFLRSLPMARYDRKKGRWKCLATPMTMTKVYGSGLYACSRELAAAAVNAKTEGLAEDLGQPRHRKTEGWRHQRKGFWFSHDLKASMLAMEMGTGKTKVAIDLVINWRCKNALILCPLSVLGVWKREAAIHSDSLIVHVASETSSALKLAQIEEWWLKQQGMPDARIPAIAVNYESAWRSKLGEWLLSQDWDVVVLDESHRIKAPDGRASKWCFRLGQRAKRRLCLTGTPMPNSRLDLFAQFRFLDAGIFGTSFARHRQYFARTNPMFPTKVEEWLNEEEFRRAFHTIAYRVEAKDVLDLPSLTEQFRTFTLSKEAGRIYRELEVDLIAEINEGVVTASNALVKLLRLQQVTSGFVQPEEGAIRELNGPGKEELLLDLLLDFPHDEPVVVFARFTRNLVAIQQTAARLGRTYGEISGHRKDLTDKGTMPEGVAIMGVQVQSGGLGIDLTRACYAVCYSIGFSLGDYQQMIARLHRPGQERPVRVYHLVAEGTVDRALYGALSKKKQAIQYVLNSLNPNYKEKGSWT